MLEFSSDKLLDNLRTSFVSKFFSSSENSFSPQLLVNNQRAEQKILTAIESELTDCMSFSFSVAFINNQGIGAIKSKLAYLQRYNVKGRILTTDYLTFTTPAALEELKEFSNLEIRVYTKGGFHPKGYIFEHYNYYSIIIGSNNLTAAALSINQEWSLEFFSCTDGKIVSSVMNEFERVWDEAEAVTPEWLKNYTEIYNNKRENNNKIQVEDGVDDIHTLEDDECEIIPNSMQIEAMRGLSELRAKGEKKALLIAATGTGKTYLSIFDVKQTNSKKILYVAHRDVILNKAEKSYRKMLPEKTTGFYNGNKKDIDADIIFASIYTIGKKQYLETFSKDFFDYIIVDEVHHAGGKTYKQLLNYFSPKFILGITATPERTDKFNVFELFDYNVPYEIRLQKALEKDLLCPFNYYGISDLTINGEVIDEKSDFKKLTCDERVRHVAENIKLFRNFSEPVKGLIFVSRKAEASELSEKLNNLGFYTKCLTEKDNDAKREQVIQELESNDNPLQYIITVDIFNEGVDIPCVNQVVLLRPTQSAIIFIQQLGRGLRKFPNKDYVSVIDFIGNYENNFFIPIALYGEYSFDKDKLKRSIRKGSSCIPGTSTIQLSEVAKERIITSITNSNFSQFNKILKPEYLKLQNRLGTVPTIMDFVKNKYIDPILFIDYAGSYYEFKLKINRGNKFILSSEQRKSLQFVSLEFAHGFRVHELLLLQMLCNKEIVSSDEFKIELKKRGIPFHKRDYDMLKRTLSYKYYRKEDIKKYGEINYLLYDEHETYSKTPEFKEMLSNESYKSELMDTLSYGILRATLNEKEIMEDHNLVLYRKYSRKDVCKILNWEKDENPQNIGGYAIRAYNDELTCPIYVTYDKTSTISDSIQYEDRFIDNSRLYWMSKNKRTLKSKDVMSIINQPENNIKIMLFLKKSDKYDGSQFFYLGTMTRDNYKQTNMKAKGKTVNVVNVEFKMNSPVPDELYEYIVGDRECPNLITP